MMKYIPMGLLLLSVLGGCAPLIIGTAAGLVVAHHENYRQRCMIYYGNPHCWPGYGEKHGLVGWHK